MQHRFPNDPVTVRGRLKKLPRGRKIASESTGSWWWFVDGATELGHEVFLSHPKQTKAIASARLKSDKVDAPMLAKLLKADLLPTVWIPGQRERHVRELLSHRGRVVRAWCLASSLFRTEGQLPRTPASVGIYRRPR